MNRFFAVVAALALLLSAQSVFAQKRNTASSTFRLVRAQCTTGPCYPGLTFMRGQGKLVTPKQPKSVTTRFFGKIKMNGLTSGSINTLEVEIEGRRIYGDDPDSDCGLANTETNGVIGSSTMNCRINPFTAESRCSGRLFLDPLTPPECSDVSIHIQDIQVNVYEGGYAGDESRRIATNGVFTMGRSPDCNSGGIGCP